MNRQLAELELDRANLLAKLTREGFGLESPTTAIACGRKLREPGNIEPSAADRSRRRQQQMAEYNRRRRA